MITPKMSRKDKLRMNVKDTGYITPHTDSGKGANEKCTPVS